MLRCMYCHRPIHLPKEVLKAVWERVKENPPQHIDIECPRCGRVNKVSPHVFRKLVPGEGAGRGETRETPE